MKNTKTMFKAALPVAALFLLASCGGNEANDHADHDHAQEQTTTTTTTTASAPVIKNDQLNAVYDQYLKLSEALINTDAENAKIAANALEAGARTMDGGNVIADNAAKISASSDVEAQRAAFENISNDLISKVKQAGLTSGEIYVEHCPMAFDDKGASWLSSNKDIRNPYFGDKMMSCGEVTETIK